MPPIEPVTLDLNAPATAPIQPQAEPPKEPSAPPPADKGKEGDADVKPKKPSPGLAAMVNAFVNDTRASKTKPESEPAKEPPKPDTKEGTTKPKEEPPAQKKVTKVAPAKAPPAPPPPSTAMTPEQIAAVAEGAARAIVQKQTPAPASEEPTLSDGSQYRLKVLEQMEKLYPDKYKGVADDYKQQLIELTDYARKWREDHPGQDFNEEDEEHADFMAAHDVVDWEDHHFRKAEVRLEAEELLAAERASVNQKITELEKKEKLRESEPEIFSEQLAVARTYWQAMGKKFKRVFTEDGQIDPVKFKALSESDPSFGLRLQAANNLKLETAEIYKLLNGFVTLDEKNPIHIEMNRFAQQCEDDMMRLPAEQRVREGKEFLPAADYWSEKITPQQRATKWTFSHRDFAEMRADDLARRVQAEIKKTEEQFQLWATKRGIQIPAERENADSDNEGPPETPPAGTDNKPESPSAATMPRLAAGKVGASQPPEKPVNAFASRFLT